MALEIIHTGRSYIVVDNEQGHWSSQSLYNSYLDAKRFALVWKAAAKYWRAHWKLIDKDYWNLRKIAEHDR